MSIKFEFKCDECNHEFSNGEPVYCSECHKELQDKISKLEDKIEDLEKENDSLMIELDQYKQDI